MKTAPLTDVTLWDSIGNSCRCELHKIGRDEFELYLHNFNSEIPQRFTGALFALNERLDRWIANKKAAGFVEPSRNQNQAWKA